VSLLEYLELPRSGNYYTHHLIIKNPIILGILKTKKCAFVALPNLEVLKKIFDNSVVDEN
jgi:hypothetical protein